VREEGDVCQFEWKQEYSVSNDAVDKDHQAFFALARSFHTEGITAERLNEVFMALEDYANGHFAREEALMKAINYPDFDAHAEQHRKFIAWLSHTRQTFHHHDETPQQIGERVFEFLEKWLVNHILKSDMRYRDYIMFKN